MAASRFDREYYDRFYRDPRTRVTSPADTNVLVAFVAAYLQHIGQPVRRVLDLGCGIGLWRKPLATHFPRARYVGVEISDYLCTKFGWQRGSAVDYRADEPFDLVICQGVLQYLTDKDARRALANLTRLVRGAVYVEALTKLDWRMHCDRERTDGAVRLRTGRWYRRELGRAFTAIGGGLWLARTSPAALFELERAGSDA